MRRIHGSRNSAFFNKEALSAGLIVAAIFFNSFLAIINAHVHTLTRSDVSLVEAAISSLAILVIGFNFRTNMVPWAFLLALGLVTHCVLAIATQTFNPLFIRDAIDIPVFIALGMVYARGNIIRFVLYIQCVVFVVLLVDMAFVKVYSNIFDVLSYYVNTRNFNVHSFWKGGSTLFISATRPNGRFMLSFLGSHRGSSVFLEPVSLGNYCILATAFTFAFWHDMSRLLRIFFIATTLILVVGSDGRLALVTCTLLAIGSVIFPRLPRFLNVLYLPGAVLLSVMMIPLLGLHPGHDNFSGRLAGSIDLLTSLDLRTFLGLDPAQSTNAADSGISYYIITQSIFGIAATWLFICFVPRYNDLRSTILIHSICLYISFNLLVSYSLFSIKTAALMWFVYGYLLPSSERIPMPSKMPIIDEVNSLSELYVKNSEIPSRS